MRPAAALAALLRLNDKCFSEIQQLVVIVRCVSGHMPNIAAFQRGDRRQDGEQPEAGVQLEGLWLPQRHEALVRGQLQGGAFFHFICLAFVHLKCLKNPIYISYMMTINPFLVPTHPTADQLWFLQRRRQLRRGEEEGAG